MDEALLAAIAIGPAASGGTSMWDRTSSDAKFRTRTAESFSASFWTASNRIERCIRPARVELTPMSAPELSMMLRTRRKRFNRTTAFLCVNFCATPEYISAWARSAASDGLSRRTLRRGSRRFGSNALTLAVLKHATIAVLKRPSLRRCASTFAVSSCSL